MPSSRLSFGNNGISPLDLVDYADGPSSPLPRRPLRVPLATGDDEYDSDDSARTMRPPCAAAAAPSPPTTPVPRRAAPASWLPPARGSVCDDDRVDAVMVDLYTAMRLDCPDVAWLPFDLTRLEVALPRLEDTLMTYAQLRCAFSGGILSGEFGGRAHAARMQVLLWEQRRALALLLDALPSLSAAIGAQLQTSLEPLMAQHLTRSIRDSVAERLSDWLGAAPPDLWALFDLERWVHQVVARAMRGRAGDNDNDNDEDAAAEIPQVSGVFAHTRRAAQLDHLLELVADIDEQLGHGRRV